MSPRIGLPNVHIACFQALDTRQSVGDPCDGDGVNIVVFMDGTWSDENAHTNVVQIRTRTPGGPDAGAQRICYVKGVGTGAFDRFRGGILGDGVDDNIRQGYRYIVDHHRDDDDRIFLFGYSRGAFTVRSLAGMIAKCGVVAEKDLPADLVYKRYRNTDAPGLREMQAGEKPARTAEDTLVLARSRLVRIHFIGVFDTVGALGIPGGVGRWLSRRRYEFHDTRLSGLVDLAFHAVAVDERRKQFEPTLCTSVPIPMPEHPTRVEQRWFVGSHSNVGGGGTAKPAVDNPLSTITREWIVARAIDAGLTVDPSDVPLTGREWNGPLDDSYGQFLGGLARLWPWNKPYLRPVRTSVGERLDGSVVRRWKDGKPRYRPENPHLEPWIREQL